MDWLGIWDWEAILPCDLILIYDIYDILMRWDSDLCKTTEVRSRGWFSFLIMVRSWTRQGLYRNG